MRRLGLAVRVVSNQDRAAWETEAVRTQETEYRRTFSAATSSRTPSANFHRQAPNLLLYGPRGALLARRRLAARLRRAR